MPKYTEVMEYAQTCIKAHVPCLIRGAPGVGKSSLIKSLASEMGIGFVDIRAAMLDPVDILGIPVPNREKRTVEWLTPDFWQQEGEGIFCLDELAQASPATQKALSQPVLDHMVGQYKLNPNWHIIAASNNATDRAGVGQLLSHFKNRFTHIQYDIDIEDWVKWALKADVMTEVIAFIRYRGDLLHQVDHESDAYPTPRSWEFISSLLKTNPSKTIEYQLMKGTIGEGPAAEFKGFLNIFRDLPDPDHVIMNPDSARVPVEPSTLYALTGALAHRATKSTIGRIIQYGKRIQPEFNVIMMRDSITKAPDVTETREFIQWASDNSHIII